MDALAQQAWQNPEKETPQPSQPGRSRDKRGETETTSPMQKAQGVNLGLSLDATLAVLTACYWGIFDVSSSI
jgi:hypothetical protein